mmetsp:Transcript_72824/g.173499  ORF Transcript_72824/g.173499 Transcript_72824/m.173499 type:complete len:268 (-) Transcript_72824:358-1161(-)
MSVSQNDTVNRARPCVNAVDSGSHAKLYGTNMQSCKHIIAVNPSKKTRKVESGSRVQRCSFRKVAASTASSIPMSSKLFIRLKGVMAGIRFGSDLRNAKMSRTVSSSLPNCRVPPLMPLAAAYDKRRSFVTASEVVLTTRLIGFVGFPPLVYDATSMWEDSDAFESALSIPNAASSSLDVLVAASSLGDNGAGATKLVRLLLARLPLASMGLTSSDARRSGVASDERRSLQLPVGGSCDHSGVLEATKESRSTTVPANLPSALSWPP